MEFFNLGGYNVDSPQVFLLSPLPPLPHKFHHQIQAAPVKVGKVGWKRKYDGYKCFSNIEASYFSLEINVIISYLLKFGCDQWEFFEGWANSACVEHISLERDHRGFEIESPAEAPNHCRRGTGASSVALQVAQRTIVLQCLCLCLNNTIVIARWLTGPSLWTCCGNSGDVPSQVWMKLERSWNQSQGKRNRGVSKWNQRKAKSKQFLVTNRVSRPSKGFWSIWINWKRCWSIRTNYKRRV